MTVAITAIGIRRILLIGAIAIAALLVMAKCDNDWTPSTTIKCSDAYGIPRNIPSEEGKP